MKLLCVQEILSRQFSHLGVTIAKRPFYFLLAPLILTAILSIGIIKISPNRDMDYLFTAVNGRAQQNRNLVNSLFPINTSSFSDVVRIASLEFITVVQIISRDGGSIFNEKEVKDIFTLDKIVKNLTVKWNGRDSGYDSLCGKRNEKCVESSCFSLLFRAKDILSGKYKVKYPMNLDDLTLTYEQYVLSLGGVESDEDGYIKDAKAVRLIYYLDMTNPNKLVAIREWQNNLKNLLKTIQFKSIAFSFLNVKSVADEFYEITQRLFVRIPIVAVILLMFCCFTCLTFDWVRSKPWLGLSACASASLALGSGFGLVSYLGIEYVDFNIVLCFVVLGTEIDDAFVLIAAWRGTSPEETVEKRMGKTYSEAGVSITITSLTNFIAYCIGITAHFPVVQIFCSYAASSIFFNYLYQIIFFGACMALSGYREEKMLNPLTLRVIKDKQKTTECNNTIQSNKKSKHEEYIMAQFRDKIGQLLTYSVSKAIIIVIFLANLGLGIWGFLIIKSGNDFSDIFSYNSTMTTTSNMIFKYFSKYYYPVHIVVNQTLNYADPEVQKSLEETLRNFEALPNMASDPSFRLSWLKYYKHFASLPVGRFLLRGYNMSDKRDFIDGVRNVFLRFPQAREFNDDIVFNEDFTEITASRFLILMVDVSDADKEIQVLRALYQTADRCRLSVRIHSLTFNLLEQALLIKDMLYQLALISAALVCLVFFFFVPNLLCSLCISIIVLCIICETIGFVAFLEVKMDMLLLTSLVLCVGFSINYPTHISFSFVTANNLTSDEKIKKSLYEIGLPIFQGLISTLLGVSILPFQPFYSCTSFFKIMCVLSMQTAFHAMFVIPVVLSFLKYCDKSLNKEKDVPCNIRPTSRTDLDIQETLICSNKPTECDRLEEGDN